MKAVSQTFKDNIKELGKEIDSYISYTIDNVAHELGSELLNSVTLHYEGNILKSVMKQLDLETLQDIPAGTEINCKFGIKVADQEYDEDDPTAYRINYEYIDYGNYIVYSSEKQEDNNTYKIICYDKMLYAMKDYESFTTYPITIRSYINSLCNHIGLTFANSNDTFVNYNNEIPNELYLDSSGNSLEYTFRDVLDELAQATASTICINDNDVLEIRYINNTAETINEEYLKDINVNFGETTKPINTITFKRSADSDAISVSYPEDLPDDEKNEIVIRDNQILNGNNRDEYIDAILNKLLGLTYYINDYTSTGITYLDLCDRYNISIQKEGDEQPSVYSCIMFNDEIEITQGLQENIHTDLLEESKTDYTKTDKTDRRINQTYLIVDKQNQTIESVVSQTIDPNNPDSTTSKVSKLSQRVGELESEISDIADLTISGETDYATLDLDNINQSEPISIKVHPTTTNIGPIYPRTNLFPSTDLYPKQWAKVRFHNKTTNEDIDYSIGGSLLVYNSEIYDEFILDYNEHICKVIHRCKYNADGSVVPSSQQTTEYLIYPTINLTDGDYTVSIVGITNGYLFARLMAKNIYTTQFYTKAETNSLLDQTSQSIDLSVNTKLSRYSTTNEMNSAINLKANEITSSVSDTYATKDTTSQLSSQITQNANSITAEVQRATNSEEAITGSLQLKVDKDDNDQVVSMLNASADEINITSNRLKISSTNFTLNKNGSFTAKSATITGGSVALTGANKTTPKLTVSGTGDANFTDTTKVFADGVKIYNSSNTVIAKLGSYSYTTSGSTTKKEGVSLELHRADDSRSIDVFPHQIILYDAQGQGQTGIYTTRIETPNLYVSGTKNRIVKIDNGKMVCLGAYETATPYFGDIGSNKTNDKGTCKIEIEDIFSQTIEKDDYKVFIQECGDGKLYVEKHKDYFVVKGTPNLEFDWEIKAIQKGYKNTRLAEKESEI